MIADLTNVNQIIKREGLNLLIVGYGGSCCNTLVDTLQKNNYKCRTKIWKDILCHCPTYIEIDIPIIYIYDNPIKSFISMKKRGIGIFDINQKKISNDNNVIISDEKLLELMFSQFKSWTQVKRSNVLIIQSRELFEHAIVNKLEMFLKTKIYHFPIIYKTPKTDITKIDDDLIPLFKKYKSEIGEINNFVNLDKLY